MVLPPAGDFLAYDQTRIAMTAPGIGFQRASNHVVIGDGYDANAAQFRGVEYVTRGYDSVAPVAVTMQIGGGETGGQFDPASLVHVDRPFKVRAIGVDETAGAYRFSGIPRHMAMLNGVNSIKTR
jgi:hypothetical protein